MDEFFGLSLAHGRRRHERKSCAAGERHVRKQVTECHIIAVTWFRRHRFLFRFHDDANSNATNEMHHALVVFLPPSTTSVCLSNARHPIRHNLDHRLNLPRHSCHRRSTSKPLLRRLYPILKSISSRGSLMSRQSLNCSTSRSDTRKQSARTQRMQTSSSPS